MLQSLFLKIPICTYFVINFCALLCPKKCHIMSEKMFFYENMILVGNWKVELDFRVLAPTSIYVILLLPVLQSNFCLLVQFVGKCILCCKVGWRFVCRSSFRTSAGRRLSPVLAAQSEYFDSEALIPHFLHSIKKKN